MIEAFCYRIIQLTSLSGNYLRASGRAYDIGVSGSRRLEMGVLADIDSCRMFLGSTGLHAW